VHVFMIVFAGFLTRMRAMITGRVVDGRINQIPTQAKSGLEWGSRRF